MDPSVIMSAVKVVIYIYRLMIVTLTSSSSYTTRRKIAAFYEDFSISLPALVGENGASLRMSPIEQGLGVVEKCQQGHPSPLQEAQTPT